MADPIDEPGPYLRAYCRAMDGKRRIGKRPRQGRYVGTPDYSADELEQARALRAQGATWRAIGDALDRDYGGIRKALQRAQASAVEP